MRRNRHQRGTTTPVAIDVHPQPPDSLSIEVPARPDRLAEIRNQLSAWLEPIALPDMMAADIVLVVNEACSNCIEHAYRDVDIGSIRVEAQVDGTQICVVVSDCGAWRAPSEQSSTRGRGLPIMRAVSRHVEFDTAETGTTVRMRFSLDEPDESQEVGKRTT
jgi:serine/threonine-protein kinase RsbW